MARGQRFVLSSVMGERRGGEGTGAEKQAFMANQQVMTSSFLRLLSFSATAAVVVISL